MPVDAKEELDAEEDSDREDDKLYCVCKTRYDEDRVMIACDRWVFYVLASLSGAHAECGVGAMNGIIHSASTCPI
jgi:hypothetical protein